MSIFRFLFSTAAYLNWEHSRISMKKIETGEDSLAWLARELDLEEQVVRKGLYYQNHNNSFTVNPSHLMEEFIAASSVIIAEEKKIRRIKRISTGLGLGVPAAVAVVVNPAVAFYAAGLFGGSTVFAGMFAMEPAMERQNVARDSYVDLKEKRREELLEHAKEFDRVYGQDQDSAEIGVVDEGVNVVHVPVEPVLKIIS